MARLISAFLHRSSPLALQIGLSRAQNISVEKLLAILPRMERSACGASLFTCKDRYSHFKGLQQVAFTDVVGGHVSNSRIIFKFQAVWNVLAENVLPTKAGV